MITLETPASRNGVPAETPAKWKMPRPTLGIVAWRRQDGSGPECYAVVTAVYESMIDVMLFPNTYSQPVARHGVKHVTDPSLKKMAQANDGGLWDFCPGETDLRALIERQTGIINDLRARLHPPDGPASASASEDPATVQGEAPRPRLRRTSDDGK